jgi:hypothetical protein
MNQQVGEVIQRYVVEFLSTFRVPSEDNDGAIVER